MISLYLTWLTCTCKKETTRNWHQLSRYLFSKFVGHLFEENFTHYYWTYFNTFIDIFFQEVYFLYTVGEVSYDKLSMKLYHPILIVLQISELSCYVILYREVSKHDEEMRRKKIISSSNFDKRKQKNLFSLYAQLSGFVLEMLYLLLIFCLRVIGRKYALMHMKGYVDAFYMTQFGLTSTIQILLSADLRQRLKKLLMKMFCS